MPKLLAFAATYRADSTNEKLLRVASQLARAEGAEVTSVAFHAFDAPMLREDQPMHPLPQGVAHCAQLLHANDGFLLAMPEYNWSMPAAVKNLIDWLSVDPSKPLAGKTALLMCASSSLRGGIMGLTQLRVPLELLHVWVYPQIIGIGKAGDLIRDDHLANEKEHRFLADSVADFVQKTRMISSTT
jgi:chromate reductase